MGQNVVKEGRRVRDTWWGDCRASPAAPGGCAAVGRPPVAANNDIGTTYVWDLTDGRRPHVARPGRACSASAGSDSTLYTAARTLQEWDSSPPTIRVTGSGRRACTTSARAASTGTRRVSRGTRRSRGYLHVRRCRASKLGDRPRGPAGDLHPGSVEPGGNGVRDRRRPWAGPGAGSRRRAHGRPAPVAGERDPARPPDGHRLVVSALDRRVVDAGHGHSRDSACRRHDQGGDRERTPPAQVSAPLAHRGWWSRPRSSVGPVDLGGGQTTRV